MTNLKIKDTSVIFKLTEYNKTGHEVYRFSFDNKEVMKWLFEQRLERSE